MMNLHLLSIDEPLTDKQMERFQYELNKAMERCGMDDTILVVNSRVNTISKEELLEALE